MKDFDGAVPKSFIESAISVSYTSLLDWKHLRMGSRVPSSTEVGAQPGSWWLHAPQVQGSLQWGSAVVLTVMLSVRSWSFFLQNTEKWSD